MDAWLPDLGKVQVQGTQLRQLWSGSVCSGEVYELKDSLEKMFFLGLPLDDQQFAIDRGLN